MKRIIEWKLKLLARWILKKYQPKIIGVTGSVGKTSTVEAIHTVLASKFSVRKSFKNYNNELGLPLSIIDAPAGGKNIFKWLGTFSKAISLLLVKDKSYPKILILEMGADKLGDIKYLTALAPCHVGLITALGPVHLELFGSLEKVVREKQLIITHLKKNDYALINIDDEHIAKTQEKTRAKIITYGFSEEAMVRASEVDVSSGPSSDPWVDVQIKGLSFKLAYKGATVPVFLPSVLGKHQVYSALAASAVGVAFGMNIADVSSALKDYKSPPGRMRLLAGIKHTSIIDDSYNSSPMAALAALRLMQKITVSGKKFVVLGDMLELGSYTEPGHREVGKFVAEVADVLVTIGERAKFIADEAKSHGMSEDTVFSFGATDVAGKFIQQRIKQGDIALIKGSQGGRLERVVKELMAEPLRATELLVRQGHEWQ